MRRPDDTVPIPFVVAIDGPSGSGKSTVARGVALQCHLRYLDTGALYRAATLATLEQGELTQTQIADLVRALQWEITADPENFRVRVDGKDAGDRIRGPQVTAAVSRVAALPEVRVVVGALSRSVISESRRGIVVEGRDISSVVAPTADVKLYLTASATVRAARRAAQEGNANDVQAVQRDLARRDHWDSSRVADPLAVAPDALVIDSSDLTASALIVQISTLVRDSTRYSDSQSPQD